MAHDSVPAPPLESEPVPTRVYWACTRDGAPWPVPLAAAEKALRLGHERIAVPELFIRPPVGEPDGLTLADAAREHLDDVQPFDPEDERAQYDAARMRIKRAVERGDITVTNADGRRLLDRASFTAWRLKWRQAAASD